MDAAYIEDLFATLGPVTVRRLFGGAGVFADDICIAIVSGGVLYLKSDAQSAPAFEAENCAPFTYERESGVASLTSFRRMPDRLHDNPDDLAVWAREALAAARRASSKKSKSTRGRIASGAPEADLPSLKRAARTASAKGKRAKGRAVKGNPARG